MDGRKLSLKDLYRAYLDWFHGHAAKGVRPVDEENLLEYQFFQEDVFENKDMTVNRVFFIFPLSPSCSNSGRLEVFAFSELNFMEHVPCPDGTDEILEILPVEYRLE